MDVHSYRHDGIPVDLLCVHNRKAGEFRNISAVSAPPICHLGIRKYVNFDYKLMDGR